MRTLVLASLTLAATIAASGCRKADDAEQTAFQVPKRDLTLQQADAPQVQVASAVELARVAPTRHLSSASQAPSRRPTAARHPAASASGASAGAAPADVPAEAPAPTGAATLPVSAAAYEPPDPNALAPGQTVTVLPASSGSASQPGWTDEGPPDARHGDSRGTTIRGGGHGGSCGGRGGGHTGGGAGPGLRGLR